MKPEERILVALDTADPLEADRLASALAGLVGGFKIGLELYSSSGPDVVRRVLEHGLRVFVDLKLHDIPNTVAGSAAALGRLGISWFTMHALGGPEMIRRGTEAAHEAALAAGYAAPTGLAVTVLTSHDDDSLERLGLAGPCQSAVLRLAGLALEAGAGGIVCSAIEVGRVRSHFADALLVVPGIRPEGAAAHDQKRTATPAGAVAAGADLLVVGRPITRSADPVAAARAIASGLASAQAG